MRKTSLVLAVLLAVAGMCDAMAGVHGEQTPKQCRNCCAGVFSRA